MLDMHLAYVVISDSCGPPDTLDRAYPFVQNKLIAFGFPDILFGPDDVFVQLLQHQASTKPDVVLGLYPAHDSRAMDMVDVDANRCIHSIVLKPAQTHLRYAWICGVWSSLFTEFMHEFLASPQTKKNLDQFANQKIDAQGDVPVGAVIQAAIRKGMRVDGVTFPTGTYIDIGTPGGLEKALRMNR
jgi:glucose-1-phosphate thymidylyltransferase